MIILLCWLALVSFPMNTFADEAPAAVPTASVPSGKTPYSSLTPEERQVLTDCSVSTGLYIAGGILGTVLGLGIGQAIEGRYLPIGLIITAGEVASFSLIEIGLSNCVTTAFTNIGQSQNTTNNNCLGAAGTIGLVGYVGLRVWEIVDVWASPPTINNRYEALQKRVAEGTHFGILPVSAAGNTRIDGASLAMQIRF